MVHRYLFSRRASNGASFFLVLIFATPFRVFAVSPMVYTNDLVAGSGISGYADGKFLSAKFDHPEGLALNDDASVLYVADKKNGRIRAIQLNQANQVTTVAGADGTEAKDGILSAACLRQPFQLVVLPSSQLAVAEEGDGKPGIRLVDLKAQTVSTLVRFNQSSEEVWNLVYDPNDQVLLFSQPQQGTIKWIDVKTRESGLLSQNQALLPHPSALCWVNGRLAVGDTSTGNICYVSFSQDFRKAKLAASTVVNKAVKVEKLAVVDQVIALTLSSDGSLYAYDVSSKNASPVFCLRDNQVRPLTFFSVFGQKLANAGEMVRGFQNINFQQPIGFVQDPQFGYRFFISNPLNGIVTSFRDTQNFYTSGNVNSDDGISRKKPRNTYRIVLIGSSAVNTQADENYDGATTILPPIAGEQLVGSRIALELNMEAALDDVPTHFEVMTCSTVTSTYFLFWYPTCVFNYLKDYDADMVIFCVSSRDGKSPVVGSTWNKFKADGTFPTDIDDKYFKLSVEGKMKTEPYGTLARLLKKKKMFTPEGSDIELGPVPVLVSDPDVRRLLIDDGGRNFAKAQRDILEKLPAKKDCPWVFLYYDASSLSYPPEPEVKSFWNDFCEAYQMHFLDITDDMIATSLSYYPFSPIGQDHFSTSGHDYWARLIVHRMLKEKLVPGFDR